MVFALVGASVGDGFRVESPQLLLGQVGDSDDLVKMLKQDLFIHHGECGQRRGTHIALVDPGPDKGAVMVGRVMERVDQQSAQLLLLQFFELCGAFPLVSFQLSQFKKQFPCIQMQTS